VIPHLIISFGVLSGRNQTPITPTNPLARLTIKANLMAVTDRITFNSNAVIFESPPRLPSATLVMNLYQNSPWLVQINRQPHQSSSIYR